MTATIKLTFDLVSGLLTEPRPVVQADVFLGGNANCSVIHANELVPYLPRGEVLVSGYAEVAVRQSRLTTLLVSSASGVIEKNVIARSTGQERTHPARVPLLYEGAFGGAGFEDNPAGMGHRGSGVPSLLPPNGALELIGYGPLSPSWKARASLLAPGDRSALARQPCEVPVGLSWDYFHCAPVDQRLSSFFRGDETIMLEGFRDQPIVLRLPNVAAMAVLVGSDGSREPMQMHLDHLAVDLEEMIAWVVFRGCADAAADKVGAGATVTGAYATQGQVRWPTRQRAAAACSALTDEETVAPDAESAFAAPFPIAEAGAKPTTPGVTPAWLEPGAATPKAMFSDTVELPARKKPQPE